MKLRAEKLVDGDVEGAIPGVLQARNIAGRLRVLRTCLVERKMRDS